MKIVLSKTLSYCFGVRKTLERTGRLLDRPDGRTYCMLGEIVHNERVVAALQARGLRVVRSLDEVPPGGVVVLQSHGTPRARYRELEERGLEFVDATCPMVEVIHKTIRRIEAAGRLPVVIGRAGHEEVRGIVGQVERAVVLGAPGDVRPEDFAGVGRAGVVVQSTFVEAEAREILDRVRALVPDVEFHDTICKPTKARQREVERSARAADVVLVVGSRRSANTMHLHGLALAANPRTHLVDRPEAVDAIEVPPGAVVFVASGASTPMELIDEVVRRLEAAAAASETGAKERA